MIRRYLPEIAAGTAGVLVLALVALLDLPRWAAVGILPAGFGALLLTQRLQAGRAAEHPLDAQGGQPAPQAVGALQFVLASFDWNGVRGHAPLAIPVNAPGIQRLPFSAIKRTRETLRPRGLGFWKLAIAGAAAGVVPIFIIVFNLNQWLLLASFPVFLGMLWLTWVWRPPADERALAFIRAQPDDTWAAYPARRNLEPELNAIHDREHQAAFGVAGKRARGAPRLQSPTNMARREEGRAYREILNERYKRGDGINPKTVIYLTIIAASFCVMFFSQCVVDAGSAADAAGAAAPAVPEF